MIFSTFSMIILTLAVDGEGLTFTRTGRLVPNVKIAQEIDISDVTFTTQSPPDSAPSLSNPKLVLAKPRVIIPVVTYHKVNHPSPEHYGLVGGGSVHYEKRNHPPKPKKWKIVPITKTGKYYVKPGKYRLTYPQRVVRPVYYLLGDEPKGHSQHSTTSNGDGGYTNTDNVKLYHEKDLQFVKPSKYSPQTYDDESLTSDNSEAAQTVGLNGDDKVSKAGDRVEFQMYGMDGPNSYKFGYDTGKGDNRHFRFEERDSEGKIRGHYGYMDNEGKMRIMKYEADPETGFHAGPVDYTPEEEQHLQQNS